MFTKCRALKISYSDGNQLYFNQKQRKMKYQLFECYHGLTSLEKNNKNSDSIKSAFFYSGKPFCLSTNTISRSILTKNNERWNFNFWTETMGNQITSLANCKIGLFPSLGRLSFYLEHKQTLSRSILTKIPNIGIFVAWKAFHSIKNNSRRYF